MDENSDVVDSPDGFTDTSATLDTSAANIDQYPDEAFASTADAGSVGAPDAIPGATTGVPAASATASPAPAASDPAGF